MRKTLSSFPSDLFDSALLEQRDAKKTRPALSGPDGTISGAGPSPAVSNTAMTAADERFLSDREVAVRYGVSRTTVWRWVTVYPNFPKPHHVSLGTTRWFLSELSTYEAAVRVAPTDRAPR